MATTSQGEDRDGNPVTYDPPQSRIDCVLAVVRDDGHRVVRGNHGVVEAERRRHGAALQRLHLRAAAPRPAAVAPEETRRR